MDDLIRRQAEYTFGNDEFSLEAAYHDCKLVFDGITDDDSFQEADTGLVLYYANEIIYALHEVLQGKDANVPTNDCISRREAIGAFDCAELTPDGGVDANEALEILERLPSAQPEQRWIPCNERMPETTGYYLIQHSRRICQDEMAVAFYSVEEAELDKNYTWEFKPFADLKEVIAWMPLPKPYKEETE